MTITDDQFAALITHLDSELRTSRCTHTLRHTRTFLQEMHADYAYIPRTEIVRANIEKLIDMGGQCDCEVLETVTPSDWQAS